MKHATIANVLWCLQLNWQRLQLLVATVQFLVLILHRKTGASIWLSAVQNVYTPQVNTGQLMPVLPVFTSIEKQLPAFASSMKSSAFLMPVRRVHLLLQRVNNGRVSERLVKILGLLSKDLAN